MALNIKDPETDRLARELAAQNGTSITEALRSALTHELEKSRRLPPEVVEERRRKIQAIIERGRALPILDDRTADEILGYDENGLPT